jgi:hypothetical protein
MFFKSKMLLLPGLIFLVTLLSGCNDKLPAELAGLADQKSLDRYAALPADSGLLLCLQSDGVLGKLPNLGPDGKQLGRFGPSTLVAVSRDLVPDLAEVDGLTGFVLWGDDQAAGKLDPMLRTALLGDMAQPNWREKEHAIIGTFDDGAGLKEALVSAGAKPGSVNGGIVTFDATSEVIFDILAWDNLRQLEKPTLLHPTQSVK